MDLRAELKWISYQMTSKRWVLATEEYNRRLVLKKGEPVVKKNYQALLRALGDIEPKLMNKIIKNDYKCECLSSPSLLQLLTTAQKKPAGTASLFGAGTAPSYHL